MCLPTAFLLEIRGKLVTTEWRHCITQWLDDQNLPQQWGQTTACALGVMHDAYYPSRRAWTSSRWANPGRPTLRIQGRILNRFTWKGIKRWDNQMKEMVLDQLLYWRGKCHKGHYWVSCQNWNIDSGLDEAIAPRLNSPQLIMVLRLCKSTPTSRSKAPWPTQAILKRFRKHYIHTHIDRERTNAKADGEKGNNIWCWGKGIWVFLLDFLKIFL